MQPIRRKPVRARRAGSMPWVAALSLALVLGLAAMVWSFLPDFSRRTEEDQAMSVDVKRENFVSEITERGNVESASNVEVRCEVQAQNSAGTRILELIPEGSYVKKGDVLCKLDDSALRIDAMKQQSVFHTSEAALIQAKNEHETAKISLEEYLEGKLMMDQEQLESDLFNAEEMVKRSEQLAQHSKKLFERGYVSEMSLKADVFAAKKALEDQKLAKTKKRVLHDYTKKKTEIQLNSDIKTAAAKAAAQEATHRLDKERLDQITAQIAKCVIRAPEPGQVVYANNNERWGGQEIIIEEGATVRERQVLFKLPDPKRMQVKAKVNESKIAQVHEGQTATIRLDAYPDMELTGVVKKVNEYPAASAWWSSNVKEYETIISVEDAPVAIKPGLTAEVRICVARQPAALQVPMQAVLEHGGKHFAATWTDEGWKSREVKIGLSNEAFVVIREGLEEGDVVARSASSLRDKLELPELPPEAPRPLAAAKAAAAKAAAGKADAAGKSAAKSAKSAPKTAPKAAVEPGAAAKASPAGDGKASPVASSATAGSSTGAGGRP